MFVVVVVCSVVWLSPFPYLFLRFSVGAGSYGHVAGLAHHVYACIMHDTCGCFVFRVRAWCSPFGTLPSEDTWFAHACTCSGCGGACIHAFGCFASPCFACRSHFCALPSSHTWFTYRFLPWSSEFGHLWFMCGPITRVLIVVGFFPRFVSTRTSRRAPRNAVG